MTRAADLIRGRLGRFVAACLALYAVVAWATDAPTLILFMNGIACSVSSGVCVAYAPAFLDALRAPVPTRGDHLGAGVFLVSLSILGIRILSFIGRDFGWPDVYNTDWMTLVLGVGILGGLFHLWAPEAIAGRIPRRHWATSGAIVGAGVFLAFLVWYAHAYIGPHVPVVLR